MRDRDRGTRRASVAAALLLVLATTGAACTDGSEGDARPPSAPTETEVQVTRVAQFANTLTGFAGNDEGELLVGDRLGAIWRLHTDGDDVPELEPEPVLDLTARVSASPGERGFFNLLLSPDGRSLVVDYTSVEGTILIERYPYVPGEAIDPDDAETLFAVPDPYAWHHGGGLAFDADGGLLVGIGDLEQRQISPPASQDPELVLGSVVRISPERLADPSATPEPGPEDVVARGLRNPWRISVDPKGDVWIGEVGLDEYEEVNLLTATQVTDGEVTNFGWPYLEGPTELQAGRPDDLDLQGPMLARPHEEGTCGMVGGFWYRGTRFERLEGRFVYADLCGMELRSFAIGDDGTATGDGPIGPLPETLTSIGQDADGELWGLGAQGSLLRFDPVATRVEGSDQSPPQQDTTTTVPRTSDDCSGGIVEAVYQLSDTGDMSGQEMLAAYEAALARVDEVLPTLPDVIGDDAFVVRGTLEAVIDELRANLDDEDAALADLRSQQLAGTGPYEGFPEAMATIVDSECG